jgi:hypothetical protein
MAKPSLSNGGVFQPLLPFQASPPVLLYGNKYGREDGNTTLGIAGVFRIALNDIKKGLNQIQPYLIVIIGGGNQIRTGEWRFCRPSKRSINPIFSSQKNSGRVE